MPKILILGGYGLTGKSLARHLLAQSGAEIVLAGRDIGKAEALAAELSAAFGGARVSARRADAADASSLRDALRGTDLLLVAAPTTQHAQTVSRAALDCGVDYLDVQLSAAKLAALRQLVPEIERAGRCFITEAGFHPGLPAAMVRWAAARMERVESAITAGYLNMGRNLPYSEAVNELMEVFRDYQAQVFKNGQWTKAGSYETRTVDFGGEIGKRQCYSMFFEELRELPGMYPSLRQAGFYMAGSHWFVDWFIMPLVLAGLKIGPRAVEGPLGRLLWWGMQTFPGPPYITLLKVEAAGESGGAPATFSATVAHTDGYELTAIPVVACLLQWMDGAARRPGLWMMGHLVEPERLFRDMQRMGVQVAATLT